MKNFFSSASVSFFWSSAKSFITFHVNGKTERTPHCCFFVEKKENFFQHTSFFWHLVVIALVSKGYGCGSSCSTFGYKASRSWVRMPLRAWHLEDWQPIYYVSIVVSKQVCLDNFPRTLHFYFLLHSHLNGKARTRIFDLVGGARSCILPWLAPFFAYHLIPERRSGW